MSQAQSKPNLSVDSRTGRIVPPGVGRGAPDHIPGARGPQRTQRTQRAQTEPEPGSEPQEPEDEFVEGEEPEGEGDETPSGEPRQTPAHPQYDPAQILSGLMADPAIQQVLAAHQEGRRVRVVSDSDEGSGGEAEPSDEFPEEDDDQFIETLGEDLDEETKRLARTLNQRFNTQLKAIAKPLMDKISSLENLAQNYERQNVNTQIKSVSSKHKDFDKYRAEMAKIARQSPGLGVEDLYILAKHRSGELPLQQPSTHSERPTPTPRRKTARAKKAQGSVVGRRAFNTVLADALENIDLPVVE